MARPIQNEHKKAVTCRIALELYLLLRAWKQLNLDKDNYLFATASLVDISSDFVRHYFKMAELSMIGKEMRKKYKEAEEKSKISENN